MRPASPRSAASWHGSRATPADCSTGSNAHVPARCAVRRSTPRKTATAAGLLDRLRAVSATAIAETPAEAAQLAREQHQLQNGARVRAPARHHERNSTPACQLRGGPWSCRRRHGLGPRRGERNARRCACRARPRPVELVATTQATRRARARSCPRLRVLAQPSTSERARNSSAAFAVTLANWFDENVLRPLLAGDGAAVIIPPPSLSDLPWGLLPSLQDRPFAVSPSATTWLHATQSHQAASGRVALVAGPEAPPGRRGARSTATRLADGDDAQVGAVDGSPRAAGARPEQRRSRRRPLHPATGQPPVLPRSSCGMALCSCTTYCGSRGRRAPSSSRRAARAAPTPAVAMSCSASHRRSSLEERPP